MEEALFQQKKTRSGRELSRLRDVSVCAIGSHKQKRMVGNGACEHLLELQLAVSKEKETAGESGEILIKSRGKKQLKRKPLSLSPEMKLTVKDYLPVLSALQNKNKKSCTQLVKKNC